MHGISCAVLKKSVGVHPGWLEEQAKLALAVKE